MNDELKQEIMREVREYVGECFKEIEIRIDNIIRKERRSKNDMQIDTKKMVQEMLEDPVYIFKIIQAINSVQIKISMVD